MAAGGIRIAWHIARAARLRWRNGVAGLAVALAACSPAALAPDSSAAARPTIVSLNPCLDAMLVELAGPEQVLALSHYSRDPQSASIPPATASRYAITGGSAEEVLALDPDIVVAGSFIAPAMRSAFEQLGIRVETFSSPTTVDESLDQIRQLGELAGRSAQSDVLVSEIKAALDRPQNGPRIETMLWQPGQIVPGETTLVAQMLARNGFASHSAARGLKQADFVSLEAVLADPPELLLIAGDSDGQRHRLLGQLDGTRIERFEPGLLYCGARTMIEVQQRLDEIRLAVAS